MGRDGIGERESVKEKEEEKELDFFLFLKGRQLNEAVECGTDGEWIQTQGNYFLAGGMEEARAPSLTGCSLQTDGGMDAVTHRQIQACTHSPEHTHTPL